MMITTEKTAIMTFAVAYVKAADMWEGARNVGFDDDEQATKNWRKAEADSLTKLYAWQDDFNRIGFKLSGCLCDDDNTSHYDIESAITKRYPEISGDSESGQMWLYGSEEMLRKVQEELSEQYNWGHSLNLSQRDPKFFHPSGIYNWDSARRYIEKNA